MFGCSDQEDPRHGNAQRFRGDQIPIKPVSARWIMSQPSFELDVADVRAGRGIHRDYDLWDTNAQWNYERGRAFTPPA